MWIPQTEADTKDLGVWDCVKLVHNFEKWNYGEFGTKVEPFAIANMVHYILGEHFLFKSSYLQNEVWNDYLTADDLAIIQKELRDYIEELSDWTDFWTAVCDEYKV